MSANERATNQVVIQGGVGWNDQDKILTSVVSHIPDFRSALLTFPVPSETQLTIACIVCRPESGQPGSKNLSIVIIPTAGGGAMSSVPTVHVKTLSLIDTHPGAGSAART